MDIFSYLKNAGVGIAVLQLVLMPILYGSAYADQNLRIPAFDDRMQVVVKLAAKEGGSIMPDRNENKNIESKDKVDTEKRIFKQLVESLNIAFENSGSLGDSAVKHGQIWEVEFDSSGRPAKPRKIGTPSDLAWPVFDTGRRIVYAIHQGRIVLLSEDGLATTEKDNQKHWLKLIGITDNGDILGIIYENDESKLAMLHSDGTITLSPAPQSDEELKRQKLLEQEGRAYHGNKSLYADSSSRGGRGFDVFFRSGEEVFNLSDCGDARCGQPSFSNDFRRVLFVHESRY